MYSRQTFIKQSYDSLSVTDIKDLLVVVFIVIQLRKLHTVVLYEMNWQIVNNYITTLRLPPRHVIQTIIIIVYCFDSLRVDKRVQYSVDDCFQLKAWW